jgi:hypothetical protein
MSGMDQRASLIIIIFGLGLSLFYGLKERRLFTYPHPDDFYKEKGLEKIDLTWSARLHGFWINFAGSMIGWVCVYLLFSDWVSGSWGGIGGLTVAHFVVFIICVLGIMGFFPSALWNIKEAVKDWGVRGVIESMKKVAKE